MTTARVRAKIIAERTSWIRKMIESLRSLPGSCYRALEYTASLIAPARRGP